MLDCSGQESCWRGWNEATFGLAERNARDLWNCISRITWLDAKRPLPSLSGERRLAHQNGLERGNGATAEIYAEYSGRRVGRDPIDSGPERITRAACAVLLLVPLPLQKLPLLVLAHFLAALLDDTAHCVFSLLRDEIWSGPMFRDSARACQLHGRAAGSDGFAEPSPTVARRSLCREINSSRKHSSACCGRSRAHD